MEQHIRPYLNGRDLTQRSRGLMVIDLFGLRESVARTKYPAVFQRVLLQVKPERDYNSRSTYREQWWTFGEPRSELRLAMTGVPRYIATVETAKHRLFCFLPAEVLPDNKVVCIATFDACHLGVLSCRFHIDWAVAAGGRLGVGNDPVYVKTRCFDPFPFPLASPLQRASIAALVEELDALRRSRLDAHPQLTMTALYNVLEKLRSTQQLTSAERDIHDAGQVSVLRHLHDQLDRAVAAAYGWPHDLPAADIVAQIVTLNLTRQAQEAAGVVQWLRPEFQAPAEQSAAFQAALQVDQPPATRLAEWPADDQSRLFALRASLAASPGLPQELSRRFSKASTAKIKQALAMLTASKQIRCASDGRYHF